MLNKLEKIKNRYNEINEILSDPDVFKDKENYLNLTREQKELERLTAA